MLCLLCLYLIHWGGFCKGNRTPYHASPPCVLPQWTVPSLPSGYVRNTCKCGIIFWSSLVSLFLSMTKSKCRCDFASSYEAVVSCSSYTIREWKLQWRCRFPLVESKIKISRELLGNWALGKDWQVERKRHYLDQFITKRHRQITEPLK